MRICQRLLCRRLPASRLLANNHTIGINGHLQVREGDQIAATYLA